MTVEQQPPAGFDFDDLSDEQLHNAADVLLKHVYRLLDELDRRNAQRNIRTAPGPAERRAQFRVIHGGG